MKLLMERMPRVANSVYPIYSKEKIKEIIKVVNTHSKAVDEIVNYLNKKERETIDGIFAKPQRQHYEERRDEYGKIYILHVETGERIYNNGGGFGVPPNSVLKYLDGTTYHS